MLAVLLSLCMVMALIPVSAMAKEFDDTQGHWAEEAIDRWSDANVVVGVGDNQFDPDGDMNRAQGAQVFANLLKLTEKADISNFTDIPANAWYTDALAKCVESGIMAGVGNNQMDPEGTITREMFFTMFAQAMGIEREDTMDGTYSDANQISDWAEGYINALVNRGYVSGTSSTTLDPVDYIDRASVMALMNKSIVTYAVTDGQATADGQGIVLVLADNVSVTGSDPITVVVANEGATVSLAGVTGDVEVVARENNVTITDAPVGTTIKALEGVTGTTANGQAVPADGQITITDTTSGGGSTVIVPPDEDEDEDKDEEEKPSIEIPGGGSVQWDDEEEEWVIVGDNDEKEQVSWDDVKENVTIVVDEKEFSFDADEQEWVTDDGTIMTDEEMQNHVMAGTNDSDPVI